MIDDSNFPSEPKEKIGRWVGIAEHVGHAMTWKILTDDTNKVLYRSNVCTATDPTSQNWRLPAPDGEDIEPPSVIKSSWDDNTSTGYQNGEESRRYHIPILDPTDLVGRTFLKEQENVNKLRVKIVDAVNNQQHDINSNPD